MSEISYENIKPLIKNQNQNGGSMECTFCCPVTKAEVSGRASIPRSDEMTDRMAGAAKRGMFNSMKWKVASAVRGALGYGILGRMGGDMAREALSGVGSGESYSDAQKQAAVVDAFRNVQNDFTWDAQGGRWISVQAAEDLLPDFTRVLQRSPVTQPYDRKILARLLCEVASADGNLDDSERSWLQYFITDDLGAVDDFVGKPPVSSAELAETASGATREVMLMLSWCVAFADQELDQNEIDRIGQMAEGLGLDSAKNTQLKEFAQTYLVDLQLENAYPGGKQDAGLHSQAMTYASNLGLAPDLAERIDIRVRKRLGAI